MINGISKSLLLSLFAILVLGQTLHAQDTKPEPCPEANVFGSPSELKAKESGRHTVVVDTKGIYRELSYEWSVVGGLVVNGQGTTEAEVRRTSETDFLVTVRVKGFRPRCQNQFSHQPIDNTPPEALRLDRFEGPLTHADDDRLEQFAKQLATERSKVFWVIFGNKKTSNPEAISSREKEFINALERQHRFGHGARLTFVNLPADEDFVEIWRTTSNTQPPILEAH